MRAASKGYVGRARGCAVHVREMPVGDDGADVVMVEIREAPDEGVVPAGAAGRVTARAARSLEGMLRTVRPVAERFVDTFRQMPRAPDEISVQFGLSLSADADVIISSAAAEANFSVTLTWTRPGDGPQR